MNSDFSKFFTSKAGKSPLMLSDYQNRITSLYQSPTIVEERELHAVTMDVFSRLMMERIIMLGTGINADVSSIINSQLLYLESVESTVPITIYINSPGGEVYSGQSISDTMNIISPPVHTVVTGMAASMASVLAANGAAGKRLALKHSVLMIHQPLGAAQGQATDIEIMNIEIQRIKKELGQMLAETTGQKLNKIMKDMDRDMWMTAKQSVEYGLIDEVKGSSWTEKYKSKSKDKK